MALRTPPSQSWVASASHNARKGAKGNKGSLAGVQPANGELVYFWKSFCSAPTAPAPGFKIISASLFVASGSTGAWFGLMAALGIVGCTRSRTVSLAKLEDLPLEVLIEILSLMEWRDILHCRQTCLWLRNASLARPVWLCLVRWYSATIQPRPFLPEKPLDLYTDRELEYLILRWQSGTAGFALTQPKELSLSTPETYVQSVQLLQGGRWLLFGARDGSVKYYDLNSLVRRETSEAVALVPSNFDQGANTIVLLSVDMDPDAEYMTFNLGIMTCRMPPLRGDPNYPKGPRYARRVEVSRVTSYWDENGQVKGLRAERLACFREEYHCGCDSFTLGGRHVAYSLYSYDPMTSEGEGENIAIVDWTLVDPTSLVYPRRLIWRIRAQWLALLPDDRLLCDTTGEFMLFDLSDIPATTSLPTQPDQRPRQDAVASFHLFVHAISQPYLIHDSIRFSVLTRKGIKGLIIPQSNNVSHKMECVDLLSHSNLSNFAHVGYGRAVLCYLPEPIVLQYGWPEEPSPLVYLKSIQTPYYSKILFDEYSSRIVTREGRSRIETILDLAAI